ncbi:hypothetical protein C475_12457 [Halosimplex carlsbadense 2-9-1]|uniref:ATP phosphoribosyltransferase n=1 Tax=Halosimplex carlsbadense 2-9-1 TaxID=797114 RepID=M0CPT6_9EURY|nr:hypothetical protein [Halosimplex carlsbadense]ELZ24402.1 hypothetical protein C475_12457 [Halosimplex carlsbadense 2-9-1]
MTTVSVAVPRKGRPLEAVLDRLAEEAGVAGLADDVISTLRYEKAVTKGDQSATGDVYERLAAYSDDEEPTAPEYTLVRDDRSGMPRRIVFDSVTVPVDEDLQLRLVGREEPFRALRKHEMPLGFDSADLFLEEVVELREEPLAELGDVNERVDPRDTDVRLVAGLGDTVWHSLLVAPEVAAEYDADLTRELVDAYEGEFCISPRYERLVEGVLGTAAIDGIDFTYPTDDHGDEEAAIAETGIGVYLTVSGGTAREHGLEVGEHLFPSETVLLKSEPEVTEAADRVADLLVSAETGTRLAAQ